jgi:hypothetical protein
MGGVAEKGELMGFLDGLSPDQWIALVTLAVAIIAAIYAAAPVHMAIRARRENAWKGRPGVQATINKSPSVDGWRSIQLHIVAPEGRRDFDVQQSGWRIQQATLLSPRNAELAFAKDGDHSLNGPIAAPSARVMSGRMGDVQSFAMEFFIRFPETPTADQGQRAQFRVKIWRKQPYDAGITLDAWAMVPDNAERERAAAA